MKRYAVATWWRKRGWFFSKDFLRIVVIEAHSKDEAWGIAAQRIPKASAWRVEVAEIADTQSPLQ